MTKRHRKLLVRIGVKTLYDVEWQIFVFAKNLSYYIAICSMLLFSIHTHRLHGDTTMFILSIIINTKLVCTWSSFDKKHITSLPLFILKGLDFYLNREHRELWKEYSPNNHCNSCYCYWCYVCSYLIWTRLNCFAMCNITL